eukprot:TRINITY_DN7469_c0_g1_i1.p1 TRINITY_DN7469_c0_g1~~TRINITY_DN7469_c0_g1_i1.p1  ORF type:complete len:323 (+),score=34.57 TRINITY_DN7469_c0_g1_i1:419-1387(+)
MEFAPFMLSIDPVQDENMDSSNSSPSQMKGSSSDSMCITSPYKTPTKRKSLSAIIPRRRYSTHTPSSSFSEGMSSSQMIDQTPFPPVAQELDQPLPLLKGCAATHADLQTIAPATLCSLIQGNYNDFFQRIIVIDCRFDYEYEGGHVATAINMPAQSPEHLNRDFLDEPMQDRVAVVFYCEFSSKRGPSTYRKLRALDRKANWSNYPYLHYPYLYVLEGGYKAFFENPQSSPMCEPQAYIEMRDKRFCEDMKESYRELRERSWKRSRSLSSCFQMQASLSAHPKRAMTSLSPIPNQLSPIGSIRDIRPLSPLSPLIMSRLDS